MGSNKLVTNLCIIHQHPKVLLGMKKRGFGAGRWNGFGGKVLDGETIVESLMREIKEEVGIKPGKTEKVGYLEFEFKGRFIFGESDTILKQELFEVEHI